MARSASIKPSASHRDRPGHGDMRRAAKTGRAWVMSTEWPRRLPRRRGEQRQAVFQRRRRLPSSGGSIRPPMRLGVDLQFLEAGAASRGPGRWAAVRPAGLAGAEQLHRIGIVLRVRLRGQAFGLQRYFLPYRPRQAAGDAHVVPVEPQRRHARRRGAQRPVKVGHRRQRPIDLARPP